MYQQPLQQCQEARVRVAADAGGLRATTRRLFPADDSHALWFRSTKQTAPIVKPPFEFPQKIVLSLSVVGWGEGEGGGE